MYYNIYVFYARRAAPHQPIHQPVNPGSSKTEAQEAPRRPPGGSKEAPGRLPGTPKAGIQDGPVPEPKKLIPAARFWTILYQNGPPNRGHFFLGIRHRVVSKRLETASDRQKLKKTGFRKGTRFGTSFGTSFGWIFSEKRCINRGTQGHLALL